MPTPPGFWRRSCWPAKHCRSLNSRLSWRRISEKICPGGNVEARFQRAVESVGDGAEDRYLAALAWMTAYGRDHSSLVDVESSVQIATRREAAVLVLPHDAVAEPVPGSASLPLPNLLGEHPSLAQRNGRFDYHEFLTRLATFERERLPRFRRYQAAKQALLSRTRQELRIDELKPRVMSSFVRNRLIDSVYLPLVGANLAKQMGTAGEESRIDRQGMLLLISPPGYGKTTLMEYVANRLGTGVPQNQWPGHWPCRDFSRPDGRTQSRRP